MLLHHTQYVITSHPLCYCITPTMLLHHTQYVITLHPMCYYITPTILLHHTQYDITSYGSHPVCYHITSNVLLHHTQNVIVHYHFKFTIYHSTNLYHNNFIFKYSSVNYLTDVAIALLASCLIRFLKLKEEISLLYSYVAGYVHTQITSSIFKCCLLFKSQENKDCITKIYVSY